MSDIRLFRGSIFLGLAYPEAFADATHPTVDELNSDLVVDLTCALWEDGTEFTLGDSASDSGLTFCSKAGENTLTSRTATVTYQALRDSDRVANGLFNKAFDHLAFADIPFIAIKRVGFANTEPFATGQRVRLVGVKTDNPVDELGADSNALLTQGFKMNDLVNWNYKL